MCCRSVARSTREPPCLRTDIEAFRPVDALVMAADVLELGSRRPDLSDAQRSELYFAALSRFRDFPGSETGLAQPWEIYAIHPRPR